MGLSPGFWRGKRVFVTGHTGFKGGWLALWLARLGAQVTGYALAPPTTPSLFELADVAGAVTSLRGDICDLEAFGGAMRQADPEIVFHLAAQALVRRSYQDPVGTYRANLLGTVHLFEAARGCAALKALVNVTSDKCYENRRLERGYREDDPLGGRDPYSSSKACAEHVTTAYRNAFLAAPGVASARAGNVIGGGDWAEDRLLPDLVRAFGEGRPAPIRNPSAVRPWQHVLDPLHGYLLLAEALCRAPAEFSRAWNFGPPATGGRDVRTVVERFAGLWGPGARWQADAQAHPHEEALLTLDSAQARERLRWGPLLELDEALGWTADWYRAHARGQPMGAFTRSQIAAYEERLAA